MDNKYNNHTARLGGYTAIGGAVTMIIGAVLWGASGTDLWKTLNNNDMADYLLTAGNTKGLLVANLTFWSIGVLILGVAGAMLVKLCTQRRALAQIAAVCYRTAIPLALVSFIAMAAVVVQIAPDTSATAVYLADVVGWIGTRADDLATALIIGIAPLFISLAGHGEWVPNWLLRWGYLAGLTGLLSIVAMYSPALTALGFIILPIGMGWMIATGVVLLRGSRHNMAVGTNS